MRIRNGPGFEPTPRPDLQEVLRHYGCYAEHSGNYLCVVHDETQPSMSVDLEKQLLNCMSCGFAGDAFSLIMEKEQVDFKRATGSAAQFTGEASDEGGTGVSSVLGRKRPGVSHGKGNRRSGQWRRPW